jgi:hypothetical protein
MCLRFTNKKITNVVHSTATSSFENKANESPTKRKKRVDIYNLEEIVAIAHNQKISSH